MGDILLLCCLPQPCNWLHEACAYLFRHLGILNLQRQAHLESYRGYHQYVIALHPLLELLTYHNANAISQVDKRPRPIFVIRSRGCPQQIASGIYQLLQFLVQILPMEEEKFDWDQFVQAAFGIPLSQLHYDPHSNGSGNEPIGIQVHRQWYKYGKYESPPQEAL